MNKIDSSDLVWISMIAFLIVLYICLAVAATMNHAIDTLAGTYTCECGKEAE